VGQDAPTPSRFASDRVTGVSVVAVPTLPARTSLDPERDVGQTASIVWDALSRQRQQLHHGRYCPARRSPSLRNPHDRPCVRCDELALDAQERVITAWRRHRELHPDATAWSPAQIGSCAQSTFADRVRGRLSSGGLVARPERWLAQPTFLPGADPVGRLLVVALVVTVGYYTYLPVGAGRIRVTNQVVQSLVDGLRRRRFAGALHDVWQAYQGEQYSCAELRDVLDATLERWRAERPAHYAALVDLTFANMEVAPLELPAQRTARETVGPAADVADIVIEQRAVEHRAAGQRGRWLVSAADADATSALFTAFVARVRREARAADAGAAGLWRHSERLQDLLVDEAGALAARPGNPAWLARLGGQPAAVRALLDLVTDAVQHREG
jgi:hypothetical protein